MPKLRLAELSEIGTALEIITSAKEHLREQGVDQWQDGYPDYACIYNDIVSGKGFFIEEENGILGYLCVDYGGERAYGTINGAWHTEENYVVVHRLALLKKCRGRGLASKVFALVEEMGARNGVHAFRIDTDADNFKMRHILQKNGFSYCGVIKFDNSEKLAFDKSF